MSLTPPFKGMPPRSDNLPAKSIQPPCVTGYVVVIAITSKQLTQPLPDHRDRLVPAPMQLRPYFLEHCSHTFADSRAAHHEHPVLGLTTETREPEEIDSFRFPFATLLAVFRREPAKPQQTCFDKLAKSYAAMVPLACVMRCFRQYFSYRA